MVFDVCVVGSANLDLVATTPRLPSPGETVSGTAYAEHAGGKGLNQAVAAARAGASCAFIAAVGDDEAGTRLSAILVGDGIDASGVQTVEGVPTGRAVITVDASAENTIVVIPGANALMARSPVPPARVVLAQLEIPIDVVIDAFTQARAAGAVTVLNPAPAVDVPDELLALCTVVIPNEHEREQLGAGKRLFALGVERVITTLGAGGVEMATVGGVHTVAAFAVEPVDTTGAGDAFCGSFATALAAGAAPSAAIRFAAAAGALATTGRGAVPSLPRRAAIDALLGP